MKKTQFAKVAVGMALLAASSMAVASVIGTHHDFTRDHMGRNTGHGTGGQQTSDTTEICVFCHTPHGANASSSNGPLWNRNFTTVDASTGYQRFSSLNRWSFDAQEAPVGQVSLACLSCHDGTQAVSSIINTAGSDTSGGYAMSEFDRMSSLASPDGQIGSASRGTGMGDMIYIGTDLRNDHPISMQYGGGGVNSGSPTGPTTDRDFAKALGTTGLETGAYGIAAAGNPGAGNTDNGAVTGSATGTLVYDTNGPTTAASTYRWWIDTGTQGYQGTDLKLYTRLDVSGSGGAQPTVECGTCHDPHSGNPLFLRLPNGNRQSQVCLTCHAK